MCGINLFSVLLITQKPNTVVLTRKHKFKNKIVYESNHFFVPFYIQKNANYFNVHTFLLFLNVIFNVSTFCRE